MYNVSLTIFKDKMYFPCSCRANEYFNVYFLL